MRLIYEGDQFENLTLYVMKTSIRKNERKTDMPYTKARMTRARGGTGSLQIYVNSILYSNISKAYPAGWILSNFPLRSPSSSLLASSKRCGEARPLSLLGPLLLSLTFGLPFPFDTTSECAMCRSSLR